MPAYTLRSAMKRDRDAISIAGTCGRADRRAEPRRPLRRKRPLPLRPLRRRCPQLQGGSVIDAIADHHHRPVLAFRQHDLTFWSGVRSEHRAERKSLTVIRDVPPITRRENDALDSRLPQMSNAPVPAGWRRPG